MSLETDRWEVLAAHQADHYRSQIGAAQQSLHSAAAREAGITPLVANRFQIKVNNDKPQNVVMWPDPYALGIGGVCMLIGTNTLTERSGFIRIGETAEHYNLEGVTLAPASSLPDVYGNQLIPKHTTADDDLHPPQIGADFFAQGKAMASNFGKSKLLLPQTLPPATASAEVLGIPSTTSSRILRSLGSLGANLAYGGATSETAVFTGVLYNMAEVLFKKAVSGAITNPGPENGTAFHDAKGVPVGTIFESASRGITVVRRMGLFPDGIAIATVNRPQPGTDVMLLEQHTIWAQYATSEMMALPGDHYDPQRIITALGHMQSTPNTQTNALSVIDDHDKLMLEHKILGLLAEYANQSVQQTD
jgi:hypothetical protein